MLRSVPIGGAASEVRTLAHVFGNRIRGALSPDGNWLAVENQTNVALARLPRTAADERVPPVIAFGGCLAWGRASCREERDADVIVLSEDGGMAPRWSSDGETLSWTRADMLYRVSLPDVIAQGSRVKAVTRPIRFTVPQHLPSGHLLLRGARIVTMEGERVVEQGDLLISDRRIAAVGPTGSIEVPDDVHLVDVSGKTIIPGMIDLQASKYEMSALTPKFVPDYAAALAYGVTTSWDPGFGNFVFGLEAARQVGQLLGPRSLSGGNIIVPASDPTDSVQDAVDVLRKREMFGAINAQSYLPWTRLQMQWHAMAAAREGIGITGEAGGGALNLRGHMIRVLDGYSGVEHLFFSRPWRMSDSGHVTQESRA